MLEQDFLVRPGMWAGWNNKTENNDMNPDLNDGLPRNICRKSVESVSDPVDVCGNSPWEADGLRDYLSTRIHLARLPVMQTIKQWVTLMLAFQYKMI